jgi:hypothetical protein
VQTEWKKGPDFAEYAEALGIRTTQVMEGLNWATIEASIAERLEALGL